MVRRTTPSYDSYPDPYDPRGSQRSSARGDEGAYGASSANTGRMANPYGEAQPSSSAARRPRVSRQSAYDAYGAQESGAYGSGCGEANPSAYQAYQPQGGYEADPYAVRSGADRRRERREAVNTAPSQQPGSGRSPYSQNFNEGAPRVGASRQRGGYQPQEPVQPTAYPIGSGQAYEPSSYAANKAAGVKPVTASDYLRTPYSSDMRDRHGSKGPLLSRRGFLAAAGGTLVAAVALGFVGVSWYTHRAVACTIDGTPREAPVGSTAADLVDRGYAYPKAGNMVSIAEEGETPAVLQQGGGEPYTLTVNGQPVNPETWRLAEGDEISFTNGSDVTEPVSVVTTEIPCGIQIPEDQYLLTPVGFVQQWGRNGVSTVETGQVSGRTIDRGVTQEPQDLIIACNTHINPEGGLKVALTFDDGPSLEYTPQYLDILARYGAKATFFNLGTQLEAGPEYQAMAKRCADEGHQVASHTYSHSDVTLTKMSPETRNDEIGKTFQLVSNATGVLSEVMRPPYGEFRGKGFLQYLANGGNIAYSAYWSVDSQDWTLPGADAIVANCVGALSGDNYNGAVILMHDGGGDRSQDVAALPRIIEAFQAAGYELVTMNDLLKADPTYPEWVWSGYVERPEGAIVPDITGYV